MSESAVVPEPSAAPAPDRPRTALGRPPAWVAWVGLAVGVAILVGSTLLPPWLGWHVFAWAHPDREPKPVQPLHGLWDPVGVGAWTAVAVVLAAVVLAWGERAARTARWGLVLVGAYAGSLLWLLSLALVRGRDGLADPLANSYEYMDTARSTPSIRHFLSIFVDHIPLDSPNNWPTHVAGHPPLATIFFIWLVRLGLGGEVTVGVVVTVIAASTCLAVLVTLRALGAEDVARRVVPFLVLTPAAVFMAVSADAVFAAVGAWGLACLALGATSRTRRGFWAGSVLSGLLLGCAVMMSYGLPVLGFPALAILVLARTWKPLPVAAVAALVVVGAFVPFGFNWLSAYPVLHDRYWDPHAAAVTRPAWYWSWGDLGDLLYSGGLLLAAGLALVAWYVVRGVRQRTWPDAATRVVLLLAGAGALMVAAADASGMSKAEVERIWLPFVPWLTVSLALLPPRWRRWGLVVPVVSALLVEQLLYTSW